MNTNEPDSLTVLPMKTILLVEDEILLREGVQETLEVHGYTVIGAADGVEALDWLLQTEVSLIITDLVMPNMNGVSSLKSCAPSTPSCRSLWLQAAPIQFKADWAFPTSMCQVHRPA